MICWDEFENSANDNFTLYVAYCSHARANSYYPSFEVIRGKYNTEIVYDNGVPRMPGIPLISPKHLDDCVDMLNISGRAKLPDYMVVPKFQQEKTMRCGPMEPAASGLHANSIAERHSLLSRTVFSLQALSFFSVRCEGAIKDSLLSPWSLDTDFFNHISGAGSNEARDNDEVEVPLVRCLTDNRSYLVSPFAAHLARHWTEKCDSWLGSTEPEATPEGTVRQSPRISKIAESNTPVPGIPSIKLQRRSRAPVKPKKKRLGF